MRVSLCLGFPMLAGATQSCDDYCTSKFGAQSIGYVQGTAPFCGGDCSDCHDGDFCGPAAKDFPDGGHTCATGSKQCCCTRTTEVTVAASAPSCDAFCVSKGIKYGYVRGTAPFCGAGPDDCCAHDYPGLQASEFSDGGDSCLTGSKQCCCGTPAGQSGCPRPGPDDLSCNIIGQVCSLIAQKAISSLGACTTLAAEGAGLCQAVGLGPADPWADACSAVIAGAIKVGCDQIVKELGQFGAQECTKAAGCAVSAMVPKNQTRPMVAV